MSSKLQQRDIFISTAVLFVGADDFKNVLIMTCCLEIKEDV
jgi:hypothetical protein